MQRLIILSVFFRWLKVFSLAPPKGVNCTANVANRTYQVALDTSNRTIDIKTDNGFRYQSTATYQYSPQQKAFNYFLTYDFGKSLLLSIEDGGKQQLALCLTSTECYLCRE